MKDGVEAVAVSVIIPVYNGEWCIKRALGSLSQQTLRPIEIICVDDASTDGTSAAIADCAARDDRIRVIRLAENRGVSYARKQGILAATGAFTMFLDADDEFTADACEHLYREATARGTDVVQFGAEVVNEGGLPEATVAHFQRLLDLHWGELRGDAILKRMESHLLSMHYVVWNKIYRTDFIQQAARELEDGYFNASEDMYLAVMLFNLMSSFSSVKGRYYKYRVGNGSIKAGIHTLEDFRRKCNRAACCAAMWRYVDREVERLVPGGVAGFEAASEQAGAVERERARLLLSIRRRLQYNRMLLTWKQMILDGGDTTHNFEIFLEAWGTRNFLEFVEWQRRMARARFSQDYRLGNRLLRLPRLAKKLLDRVRQGLATGARDEAADEEDVGGETART